LNFQKPNFKYFKYGYEKTARPGLRIAENTNGYGSVTISCAITGVVAVLNLKKKA
jgi:hypothetical protein